MIELSFKHFKIRPEWWNPLKRVELKPNRTEWNNEGYWNKCDAM